MTVHNHPPYRPVCNEREVDGQLRGACLTDAGLPVERLPVSRACHGCLVDGLDHNCGYTGF